MKHLHTGPLCSHRKVWQLFWFWEGKMATMVCQVKRQGTSQCVQNITDCARKSGGTSMCWYVDAPNTLPLIVVSGEGTGEMAHRWLHLSPTVSCREHPRARKPLLRTWGNSLRLRTVSGTFSFLVLEGLGHSGVHSRTEVPVSAA